MILKNNRSSRQLNPKVLAIVLLSGLILVFLFLFRSANHSSENVDGNTIFCDAEVVKGTDFCSHGALFNKAATQSDAHAFSGRFFF